jgi:hypothetical protein
MTVPVTNRYQFCQLEVDFMYVKLRSPKDIYSLSFAYLFNTELINF